MTHQVSPAFRFYLSEICLCLSEVLVLCISVHGNIALKMFMYKTKIVCVFIDEFAELDKSIEKTNKQTNIKTTLVLFC